MFDVRKIIERLSSDLDDAGIHKQESGAWLLGPLPSVGPHAFLHIVFEGISCSVVESFSSAAGTGLPTTYKDFLSGCNGMILYQGALSIYGVCKDVSRSAARRQPYSFVERNVVNRPVGSMDGQFFIGSFNWDGSLLYLEPGSSVVHRRELNSTDVIGKWSSIDDLLDKEISRISKLFDRDGLEIDPTRPTSPVAVSELNGTTKGEGGN